MSPNTERLKRMHDELDAKAKGGRVIAGARDTRMKMKSQDIVRRQARAATASPEEAATMAGLETQAQAKPLLPSDLALPKMTPTQRVELEEALLHAHESPIPDDAPAHVRVALERIKALSPEERAAGLRAHVTPVPERTRGHFTLDPEKP